jgi:hypothetical protein
MVASFQDANLTKSENTVTSNIIISLFVVFIEKINFLSPPDFSDKFVSYAVVPTANFPAYRPPFLV